MFRQFILGACRTSEFAHRLLPSSGASTCQVAWFSQMARSGMQTSAEIARRRPCLTWSPVRDYRPSTGRGGSFNRASPWETCLLQLCLHRSEREFDTQHFLDALATPSCGADEVDLASGQVRLAAGIPLKKHDDGSPSSWFWTKPCHRWLICLTRGHGAM